MADAREAGHGVAYRHLRMLAKLAPVYLVSFVNDAERGWGSSVGEYCRETHLIPLTRVSRLGGVLGRPSLPAYVALRYSPRVAEILADIKGREKDLIVWAEYTQMAQYLGVAGVHPSRWAVSCQDVLWQLIERRLQSWPRPVGNLLRFEVQRARAWEAQVLRRAGCVVAFSTKDQDLLSEMGVAGVELSYPVSGVGSVQPRRSGTPSIIFLGSLARLQNFQAMEWFATNVLPRIVSRIPNVQVQVVGERNQQVGAGALGDRIKFTGYLPDLSEALAAGWVAIAPLQTGAGIKVKVVDYLASGLPVVATTVGAEGIPATAEDGLFVADGPQPFADECLRLLTDHDLRRSLSARAQQWYRESYSPRVLTEERIGGIVRRLRNPEGEVSGRPTS